jgi:hypothetical protein
MEHKAFMLLFSLIIPLLTKKVTKKIGSTTIPYRGIPHIAG